MSISQSKYISITSGIGGGQAVSRKELIGRIFSNNILIPTNTVLEFTDATNVSNYFGSNSKEAKVANEYFGWISKSIKKAKKISFFRYLLSGSAPTIISTIELKSVENFKLITDGSFKISIDGISYEFKNIDLSSVVSYNDIANTIQTKIREQIADAELEYIDNRFIFNSGTIGNAVITYAEEASEGTNISDLLGFSISTNAILSNGINSTTLQDLLNKSIDISTNFATFGFLDSLSIEDLSVIGSFVNNQNMQYLFCGDCSISNYTDFINECKKYNGISLNLNINYGLDGLPAFLMPMILCATTDYNSINGTINYMYQQFNNQDVSVDNDFDADKYDKLNINYNGQTQKSGQKLSFYQDGYNTNGTDTSIFCNEIWLKDAIATEFFNTFMAIDKVSADRNGKTLLDGNVYPIFDEAKNNGVFALGKELDNTQKSYIDNNTGESGSWFEVQNNGFIYISNLKKETSNNKEKWIYEYTLIYSKGDSIRKVEGTNILI